jgi:ATP-dependent Clp protease ATP-binding subunit ClpA
MQDFGFRDGKDKHTVLREDEMKEKVMQSLREKFKPEFLNRVDEIIIFHPLGKEQIKKIIELQLEKVCQRLLQKNIKLEVSQDAEELLAKVGFDPIFGARPLKRAIQNMVLDELALRIIEGKIKENSRVRVGVKNGKIVFG